MYQTLALSPALSIADNMFLGRGATRAGRHGQWFRATDRARMAKFAREKLNDLGLMTIQNIHQPVETLSGGQRQGVAVARAAAFAKRVVIMDEPTAALGVKESRRVLELSSTSKSVDCRSSSSRTTCPTCSKSPTVFTSTGWAAV